MEVLPPDLEPRHIEGAQAQYVKATTGGEGQSGEGVGDNSGGARGGTHTNQSGG